MQNRSYDMSQLNNKKDVFDIVDTLAKSSEKLLQSEREARQPDAIDVLEHFAIMKHLLKTVPNFHFPNKFYTMNANKRPILSSKARFLLNNIAVAVNRLPRQYRSLTEDSNSCSFFMSLLIWQPYMQKIAPFPRA